MKQLRDLTFFAQYATKPWKQQLPCKTILSLLTTQIVTFVLPKFPLYNSYRSTSQRSMGHPFYNALSVYLELSLDRSSMSISGPAIKNYQLVQVVHKDYDYHLYLSTWKASEETGSICQNFFFARNLTLFSSKSSGYLIMNNCLFLTTFLSTPSKYQRQICSLSQKTYSKTLPMPGMVSV